MDDCQANAKLWVVGIGPGNIEEMSLKAYQILRQVDVIIGYKRYIELIKSILSSNQELISNGMRGEIERVEKALTLTNSGKQVAIISSGDSGIYGMAGLVLESKQKKGFDFRVEVIPGITAASAAAASLGAPLMHDFAFISLSDLLTPWLVIQNRLEAAARADFAIALYNPKSKERSAHLKKAQTILLKYKKPDTPVGIVRNACRGKEEKSLTTLGQLSDHEKIDMLTIILIGNSQTFIKDGLMITPRGYKI